MYLHLNAHDCVWVLFPVRKTIESCQDLEKSWLAIVCFDAFSSFECKNKCDANQWNRHQWHRIKITVKNWGGQHQHYCVVDSDCKHGSSSGTWLPQPMETGFQVVMVTDSKCGVKHGIFFNYSSITFSVYKTFLKCLLPRNCYIDLICEHWRYYYAI